MNRTEVYARSEPAADGPWRDVVVYRDQQCTSVYCRIPGEYTSKPTRRNRWIVLNCFRYRLVWV